MDDDIFGNHFAENPPELLWHYTTASGLLGIVRNKQLWATDARFLNDAMELKAGLKYVCHVAGALANSTSGFRQRALKAIEGLPMAVMEQNETYTISFSQHGDQLSQWRGYAGGEGYSLGLLGRYVAERAKADGWRLGRCIYVDLEDLDHESNRKAKSFAEAIINRALMTLPDVGSGEENIEDDNELAWVLDFTGRLNVLNQLSFYSAFFKDKGFEEEDEWRLVCSTNNPHTKPKVEFRPGRTGIVPYVNWGISPDGVHQLHTIRIGPNPHSKLAEYALQTLLNDVGLPSNSLLLSNIPYRK